MATETSSGSEHFQERQRAAARTLDESVQAQMARAFSGRPRVLFADEPTGNLDRQTGDRIADLLFSLNRDFDTTLILVTHDETLAARCQRRLRLREGKLWEEA